MLRNFSGWELLVVLVIILLLFGVGRISKIASELGSGIRAFRKGLKGEGEESDSQGDSKSES